MDRLQKKCLLTSAGMHGFLLLLLAFGSAFFVAKEKPITYPKLQFVPSKFVESAIAGGGGNPNLARTDDVQKGSPDAPKQLFNPPPQQPAPAAPSQPAQPPAPKPEPKRQEPKQEAPKIEASKKPAPKPVEPAKPKAVEKTAPTKPRIDLSELKPVNRTAEDKQKKQAEEEAREIARQRAEANARAQRLAQQFGKAADAVQRGFASGTKVDVGGPGGEAYANYAALVQMAYESAWIVQPEMTDDDSVALVRVTIARNGRILESRIIRRSGSVQMDRTVQRALDRVKSEGLPPFPDFIKEPERSFTIEFNLKAKKLLG